MRITESKFRRIMAEEIRRLHEVDADTESQVREMEAEDLRIAKEELEKSLEEYMEKMSLLGIGVEDACENLTNIVKEFCKDKNEDSYEHQMTYGDEDEDSDDSEGVTYRKLVEDLKEIIETGGDPEDSDVFDIALQNLGETMAYDALQDAMSQSED